MKQNLKNILLSTGTIVLLAVILYSCGGGGYGGGGGGSTAPPMAFNLVSPADLATNVTTTPTLSWTAEASATDYRVQVELATGNFTGTLLINAMENATTYSYMVPGGMLTMGIPYHWRVVAENIYGQSIAGPRTFTP